VSKRGREVRLGWLPATYGGLVAFTILAMGGLAGAIQFAATGTDLTEWVQTPLYVGAGLGLPVLIFATLTMVRMRRLQRGTPGRFRLSTLGVLGAIDSLAFLNLCGYAWFLLGAYRPSPFGGFDPQELLLALEGPALFGLYGTLVVFAVVRLLLIFTAISIWFLTPEAFRTNFWRVIDTSLLGGFIAVTIYLPIDPPTDDLADVIEPAFRLAISALFGIRALVRMLPPALDGVERMGFNPLVAARHLRAKKSNFITIIGVLSIASVTVSSCALTTTLSVMGGFRNDLKRKILGNNAHVVIDKEHDTFGRWVPTLQAVREVQGVEAAAPYVTGEVMVTSASNLAGAVLRGIDPASASEVIDLEANLVHGRLDYLSDPELLLDLPPENTGSIYPMNIPTIRMDDGEDEPDGPDGDSNVGSPIRDIDELLGQRPDGPDPGLVEDLEDLERLIRDGPLPIESPREVLPGIIVGQELARSLRLYVGDEVNVVSPLGELGPAGPMPKSRPFRVAGIFYSGMYEYDMKYTYVMLSTAQRFLNVGEEISGIEIKVTEVEVAPEVGDRVEARVSRQELRVQDWRELNRTLFGALELERLAMFVFLGIAILVAGFCVFATLTLMVQEKSSEMGILKAMGAARGDVVRIFLIEGLLIGLLGAGLGCSLGYVACFAAEHFGIRMNPEVYYIDKLPVHIDNVEFAVVGIASVIVCVLATIFPALLASRTRPVDALRFD